MKKYLWLFNLIMVRYLIYFLFSISVSSIYYFIFYNIYVSIGIFVVFILLFIILFEFILNFIKNAGSKQIEMYEFILNYHDDVLINRKMICTEKVYSKKLNELINKNKEIGEKGFLEKTRLYFGNQFYDEFLDKIERKELISYIKHVAIKYELLRKKYDDATMEFKKRIIRFFIRESIFYSFFSILLISMSLINNNLLSETIIKYLIFSPVVISLIDGIAISLISYNGSRSKNEKENK